MPEPASDVRTNNAAPPGGIAPRRPVMLGLPGGELSEEQRADALRRVQSQAENRVKLGMQLFKSAEARLTAQADLARAVRSEQAQLGERVDQRLDALSTEIQSLRDTHQPAASPELLQRVDRLEHAVQQALDANRSVREEHARAIDRLRREQATLQEQARLTRDRLAAFVEKIPPAPAGPAAASQPSLDRSTLETLESSESSVSPRTESAPSASKQASVADSSSTPSTLDAQPTAPGSDDDTRIYSSILDRLRHTQRQDVPDSDATPAG